MSVSMDSPQKSTRRQFLAGQSAAQAARDLVDRALPDDELPPTSSAAEPFLVTFSRRAMACDFEVKVRAGQFRGAAEHVMAALDVVEALEAQLSAYRDTSEISAINRAASDAAVRVDPALFDFLETCVELWRLTQGAFDITAGPLIKLWGFFRRQGAVPSAEDLARTMALVGSDKLLVDRAARTIRFAVPGMELNLGSIGKGYALDRCAERLRQSGITDFLCHGGRSSILAGETGETDDPSGWRIGVDDPLRPGRRLAELRVRNRAVGTSAATNQSFFHQGRRYGHLLDPRTGRPAAGVYQSTVLAPTAAMADALATACYVLGADAAVECCKSLPGVALFMVCAEPEGGMAIKTHRLAEGEGTVLAPA
ncbi:MAG: FAD:protein FMN transferase [Planctomycetia bacterium]|nr:FAD:protein FMN transferase [Planctomycetia bacterium]